MREFIFDCKMRYRFSTSSMSPLAFAKSSVSLAFSLAKCSTYAYSSLSPLFCRWISAVCSRTRLSSSVIVDSSLVMASESSNCLASDSSLNRSNSSCTVARLDFVYWQSLWLLVSFSFVTSSSFWQASNSFSVFSAFSLRWSA